jgi:hypothetical protein
MHKSLLEKLINVPDLTYLLQQVWGIFNVTQKKPVLIYPKVPTQTQLKFPQILISIVMLNFHLIEQIMLM